MYILHTEGEINVIIVLNQKDIDLLNEGEDLEKVYEGIINVIIRKRVDLLRRDDEKERR